MAVPSVVGRAGRGWALRRRGTGTLRSSGGRGSLQGGGESARPARTGREVRQRAARGGEPGWLPLALEQAGAYLHQTGTGLGTYRRLLGRVLDTAPDGIDPQRTIARIWDHTITAIGARDPLAVTLLHIIAWLAPDAIPRTLLAPSQTARSHSATPSASCTPTT
ncbi:hypothetical protein [Actinacidiphila sp. ITFR-21]|uniref:hypothetical protein n=1 Tax=Actinacidiphila sp. ITFR-21 TaxID=3075199 RepID=UPI00288B0D5F|nr:hypothetical protein [Streptomyces sp. ITFR-21]WNI15174.1 hypothetical protein RLT57_06255 [Streptomyces sp. ITFR-21]